MKRWVIIGLLGLFFSGCVEGYSHNDLRMLTAYRAKEVCSCLFVQKQTEAYCQAYTVAFPNLASYSVDFETSRFKQRHCSSGRIRLGTVRQILGASWIQFLRSFSMASMIGKWHNQRMVRCAFPFAMVLTLLLGACPTPVAPEGKHGPAERALHPATHRRRVALRLILCFLPR